MISDDNRSPLLEFCCIYTSKAEKYPTDIIEVSLFQKPARKAILSNLDFNYVSAATAVRVAWSYISRRLSNL